MVTSRHHNVRCCEETRSIDALLRRYAEERAVVVTRLLQDPKLLISDLWTVNSPLGVDNECQCQMGHGEMFTAFMCAQCKSLTRISDFQDRFAIQCGNASGAVMLVIRHDLDVGLRWKSPEQANRLLRSNSQLRTCGSPSVDGLQCVVGDQFTNHLLIAWMVEFSFYRHHLPSSFRVYTGFVCNGAGYTVEEEVHPLDMIDPRGVILQLTAMLHAVRDINLSLGEPLATNLKYRDEPCSYVYANQKIEAPFTLVFDDFRESSMMVADTHYSSRDSRGGTLNVTIGTVQPFNDYNTYVINGNNVEIFQNLRHSAPLFVGSFDLYCFFVSLMADVEFFSACRNDPYSYALWKHCWLKEDDRKAVEEELSEFHVTGERPNFDDVLLILHGKTLQCEITFRLLQLSLH